MNLILPNHENHPHHPITHSNIFPFYAYSFKKGGGNTRNMNWTDDTIMTFGKHKGTMLIQIPDYYFHWFWKENQVRYKAGQLRGDYLKMMDYIKDSFSDLPTVR